MVETGGMVPLRVGRVARLAAASGPPHDQAATAEAVEQTDSCLQAAVAAAAPQDHWAPDEMEVPQLVMVVAAVVVQTAARTAARGGQETQAATVQAVVVVQPEAETDRMAAVVAAASQL